MDFATPTAQEVDLAQLQHSKVVHVVKLTRTRSEIVVGTGIMSPKRLGEAL